MNGYFSFLRLTVVVRDLIDKFVNAYRDEPIRTLFRLLYFTVRKLNEPSDGQFSLPARRGTFRKNNNVPRNTFHPEVSNVT